MDIPCICVLKSDFTAVVYVPDLLKILLLLWQGAWIVLGSDAGALRPHKHSQAPSGATASGKDISEVSCGCDKLLRSAPQQGCDLPFSTLAQPASEAGKGPMSLQALLHGGQRGGPIKCPCLWRHGMMENEVGSGQVWDPRKSVASGRWRGWEHAEKFPVEDFINRKVI